MNLPEYVQRLIDKYWNADRKTVANPGGFGGNGHEEGYPDSLVDVGNACQYAGEQAEAAYNYALDAAAAAAQAGTWLDATSPDPDGLGWTVAFVGPGVFTAVGDKTGYLAAGRAVRALLNGTPVYSHVSVSVYASGAGLTTCVLADAVLSSALSGLALGQDPRTAPAGGMDVMTTLFWTGGL